MIHSFVIEPVDRAGPDDEPGDRVLRPYAELEAPGSLYVAAIALFPGHQGKGLGTRMLEAARQRARATAVGELSLLCFESNAGARGFTSAKDSRWLTGGRWCRTR